MYAALHSPERFYGEIPTLDEDADDILELLAAHDTGAATNGFSTRRAPHTLNASNATPNNGGQYVTQRP